MTFEEIQREVKTNIKDANPNILLSVGDYVNEALSSVVSEVSLPSLKTYTTLTTVTTQAWVNTPSGFDGRLLYVGNSDGAIKILDGGLQQLISIYPTLDDVGSVEYVALEGNVLWYQGIPSTAETLYIIMYNNPSTLVEDNDTPSDIPDYFHREILVSKACALAYAVIEDGLTGDKTNTMFYENVAANGVAKLKRWILQRRSNVHHSIWDV